MIVYAVNIHTGGGKVLLDELITSSVFGKISYGFFDNRYVPPPTGLKVWFSKSKLLGRISAEFNLHRMLAADPDTNNEVLFFGNIPPFFKPRGRSILYLQNCFLTRQVPLPKDTKKEMLRNWFESLFLKLFARNIDEIWVQTQWMREITQTYLPKATVKLMPFLPKLPQVSSVNRRYKFIFVGSLAQNKRFDFFIESLSVLDSKIASPIQVAVVLDSKIQMDAGIPPKLNHVQLFFFNNLSREELARKYCESESFVSTSRFESFCLPLYEAQNYKCNLVVPIAGYTENLNFNAIKFNVDSSVDLAEKLNGLI